MRVEGECIYTLCHYLECALLWSILHLATQRETHCSPAIRLGLTPADCDLRHAVLAYLVYHRMRNQHHRLIVSICTMSQLSRFRCVALDAARTFA